MPKEFYKRTFTAGRYRKVVLYTRPLPGDSATVRAAKSAKSTGAQRYINIANCTERLLWLLCCNFDHKSAAFVTLTYDDEHLPGSRDAVKQNMQTLIPKVRRAFRQAGQEFPVVYTVEGFPLKSLRQADSAWEIAPWKDQRRWDALAEDSEDELREEQVRLHAHAFLLLPNDEDRALIRSLWPYGKVHINYIRVNDFTSFQRLAAYVTKESRMGIRPVNERSYVPSLGLIKPEVNGRWCEADEAISTPPSAEKELRHIYDKDPCTGAFKETLMYRFPRSNAVKPQPYKSKGRISHR